MFHIASASIFVGELYTAGVMKLIPLRTHLMVADALTKRLPGLALPKHREIMVVHMPFMLGSVIAGICLVMLRSSIWPSR